MIFTITGPESCGKSTIFDILKKTFNGCCVPEYSREYLNNLGRNYRYSDLALIAQQHIQIEKRALMLSKNLLLDTDLMTIKIWGRVQFGKCPRIVSKALKNYSNRKFILLYPDLPWEPDPLRENPLDRDMLFEMYLKEVVDMGCEYVIVKGSNRLEQASTFVENSLT